MRKYYKIPLLFFFLAAGIGLFLRWQFIMPTPGMHYTFFVHAHSHVMFLGWVFNVLYLSFIDHHLAGRNLRPFHNLFILMQLTVVAMAISFPIQGYGMFSIIFSTLHTLAAIVFIVIFFRRTSGQRSVSLWFARTSLFFFFLSTAGPFALGYLMANGLGGTVWYNFSIYYYLHFQYNGFFLFGIFSLFYQLLEQKQLGFNEERARTFGRWMATACIPAYFLSTLFAKPGLAFNIIGFIAACMQIFALAVLILDLKRIRSALYMCVQPAVIALFLVALASLMLKSILQVASAHPDVAQLAYELRPVVIAYLHLVLLGIITSFLLGWFMEMKYVEPSKSRKALWVLLIGYAGSELCLVLMPWWSALPGEGFTSPEVAVFGFSVLLTAGALLFFRAYGAVVSDISNQ